MSRPFRVQEFGVILGNWALVQASSVSGQRVYPAVQKVDFSFGLKYVPPRLKDNRLYSPEPLPSPLHTR